MLLAGMLMGGMDLTILNIALPTVGRELVPSSSELLWIMDGYALTVAATLVVCSTPGDRLGRKRILMTGVTVFALASLAAALSSAPGQLIAARAVQGLGYSMMLSSTVVIIRVVFPVARERSLAYGLWVASSSTGAALGPVLGGRLATRPGGAGVDDLRAPSPAAAILRIGVRPSRDGRIRAAGRTTRPESPRTPCALPGPVGGAGHAAEESGTSATVLRTCSR